MSSDFTLELHPASEGDALILSWGAENDRRYAIVDLGRTKDYGALREHLGRIGRVELLAVTHIDADHIAGAMPLVREARSPVVPNDVWFNAFYHLKNAENRLARISDREALSGKQGEKLSNWIVKFRWPWNRAFEGEPVSVDSPKAQAPIILGGGLNVHLLSPSDEKLAALRPKWLAELTRAHLQPLDPDDIPPQADDERESLGALDVERLAAKRFVEDTAIPNGSSIAFVAEYAGRRILLAADAHPKLLETSLRRLGASETNRYRIDCFKLSHHGSKSNTSPELLKIIDCTCFAFSTDGTGHGHPDPETIARILVNDRVRPKTLVFNFAQPQTLIWNDTALMAKYAYSCRYPTSPAGGISIEL
jgi:beta-lactamase superfamily II metal-dependent hydrolase